MISQTPTLSAIRVVRVCHVHPEGHAFDGIFCDSGDYARNVQVLSPMAGTDFGFASGIPSPEQEGWDKNREINPGRRDVLAVVATCSAGLLCLGYLYPQVNQLAFTKAADKNRLIERHTSDFYRTISDLADADWVHPGGAWIRMGLGPIPDLMLTPARDYDKRWLIKRNMIPPMITLASPLGILVGGGIMQSQVPVPPTPPAPLQGVNAPAALVSAEGVSAPAALMSAGDMAVPLAAEDEEDEEDKKEEEDIGQMTGRFPGVCGFKRNGSFFMDVLDAKMRVNADGQPPQNGGVGASFGPTFQWQAGESSVLIYWDKIVMNFGSKVSMAINKEGIAMEVGNSLLWVKPDSIELSAGETKLNLTADGITTTGDMTTEGVHTDSNGVHVDEATSIVSGTF